MYPVFKPKSRALNLYFLGKNIKRSFTFDANSVNAIRKPHHNLSKCIKKYRNSENSKATNKSLSYIKLNHLPKLLKSTNTKNFSSLKQIKYSSKLKMSNEIKLNNLSDMVFVSQSVKYATRNPNAKKKLPLLERKDLISKSKKAIGSLPKLPIEIRIDKIKELLKDKNTEWKLSQINKNKFIGEDLESINQ